MSILDKSSDIWSQVYMQYDEVLKAKAATQKDNKKRQNLLLLDKWYQQELPTAIQGRSQKFISHEELAKLMKWKLTRGKFRPRLQELAEGNSSESVHAASKKAFKVLPNVRAAIEALVVLKGIGPATASAVLAAGAPEIVPFMADESMLALPGLQPLSYTLPAFLDYTKQVMDITKSLQKQDKEFGWTAHQVEITLWTFEMAKKMNLENVLQLLKSDTSTANSKPRPAPSKRKSQDDSDKPIKKTKK